MELSNWTEEDHNKVVGFLNKVAKHASFNMSMPELVAFYKDLSWMQGILLKKIKDNTVYEQRVYSSEELKAKPKKGSK